MNNWVMIASAASVVVLSGAYMGFFGLGFGARKSTAPKRDMRMTWKIVQLGGPLPEGLGLADKVKYGVIISSDEMLAQTQTLLFCPLINGLDDDGNLLAMLPWHVPVEIREAGNKDFAQVEYGRKYVSTKIVLPIGYNEIDMDGRERGYLDEHSRAAVAAKLAAWFPPFAKIAHH